jgi:hypothetical protein
MEPHLGGLETEVPQAPGVGGKGGNGLVDGAGPSVYRRVTGTWNEFSVVAVTAPFVWTE